MMHTPGSRMLSGALACCVSLPGLLSPAAAQPVCNERWVPTGQEFPGVNGIVFASTIWDPDGAGPQPPLLVVGGDFTVAGAVAATNLAAWDGASWRAIGGGVTGDVRSLAVFNGDLIVGGAMTRVGTLTVNHIARWNGTAWSALGGIGTGVYSLAAFNGELIAAGGFASNNHGASRVMRWNGTTWPALGDANGDTQTNGVAVLLVRNGELLAGGQFTAMGGVATANIARWNGLNWAAVGGGMNAPVYGLVEYGGDLVAVGNFTSAGGAPAAGVARWDGAFWNALGASPVGGACVTTMGADLIVGGWFVPGWPALPNGVARWNGSGWEALGGGTNQPVYTLAMYQGRCFAGGWFTAAGPMEAHGIASWNGAQWGVLGGGIPNGAVQAFTTHQGALVAAGRFTAINGVPANRVARWTSAAGWSALGGGFAGPAGATTPQIEVVAPHAGELVAAGVFDSADGASAPNIAAWNGAAWHALGSGLNGEVHCLTDFEGDLIAGGAFGFSGAATPLNRIARWDGQAWRAMGDGLESDVRALAVYNGQLIAGGSFLLSNGARGVARWDGTAWQYMGAELTAGITYAMTIYNGDLIAAGTLVSSANHSIMHIARWDGTAWRPLSGGLNTTIVALAVYGGELLAADSQAVHGWDGAAWRTVTTIPSAVAALHVFAPDDDLYIGGSFQITGPVTAVNLARWHGDSPPAITSAPAAAYACPTTPAVFSVTAAGTTPIIFTWRRAGVTIASNPRFVIRTSVDGHTSTLTIQRPRPTDAAIVTAGYSCTALNYCGTVTSAAGSLTVCAADFDDGSAAGLCDGGVTIDDLLYYLSLFVAGNIRADLDNGSGTGTPDAGVTIDDLFYYLARFAAGC